MILVFVDFMDSEEEIPMYKKYLKKLGIAARVTDEFDSVRHPSAYTHVFLDYGGMNLPGNSMFEHLNHEVEQYVTENPSTEFIIISVMGKTWFEQDLDFTAFNLSCMKSFLDKDELLKILNQKS